MSKALSLTDSVLHSHAWKEGPSQGIAIFVAAWDSAGQAVPVFGYCVHSEVKHVSDLLADASSHSTSPMPVSAECTLYTPHPPSGNGIPPPLCFSKAHALSNFMIISAALIDMGVKAQ